MKLYLVVARGKHQGMPILIKVDLFLMGSDRMCQLRSTLPGMAPQHCAVITRGKRVFVRDMDGGGKTTINGETVPPGEEWPVHAGDRLAAGPLEFIVQYREKDLAERDAEEWALRSLDVEAAREEKEFDEEDRVAGGPANAAAAAASILGKLQMQRGIVKGRLRIVINDDITVIRFNDTHIVEDAEIAYLRKELSDSVNRSGQRILLDFKNVRRMSSRAVEMLLDVCRRVRDKGGSVACCRVRDEIHSILDTLGVFRSIPHYHEKKAALAAKW